jgi:hypothetical protein
MLLSTTLGDYAGGMLLGWRFNDFSPFKTTANQARV